MATLNDYYNVGGILGAAVLGSATSTDSTGAWGYQYNPQQWYATIGDYQNALDSGTPVGYDKAKGILESLRSEINNWCANALEVA